MDDFLLTVFDKYYNWWG